MKVAAVDSNVLLRALLDQVPEQSRQARALLETPDMVFRVFDTALIEFVFVLERHYGFKRVDIADMVKALAVKSVLVWDRQVGVAAVEAYVAHPKLSFEDCLMAEQAKATDSVPLFTFDRKLARQHDTAELAPATPHP